MQLDLLCREITPDTVLAALLRRVGAANGATAAQLASEILGTRSEAGDERRLRQVIEQLRIDGHPVCATPEEGYHLAANADDLNRTCVFLLRRLSTTARQVAAMKRVAMPDLYGQFGLLNPDATSTTQGTEP
jgi:hypothetical protein